MAVSRPLLAIALGALLLLSPVAVGAVDLGAKTRHYDVGYVEVTADGWNHSGSSFGTFDAEIRCWGSLSRICQLERSLVADNVSIDTGPVYYNRHADYRFVYHDGRFYETGATSEELYLRRVNASRAVDAVADDGSGIPAGAVSALQDGETDLRSHASLPTHALIALGDGRYATLSLASTGRTTVDGLLQTAEPFLGPLGFLLGLGLVLEGQRWRVRRRLT